MPKMRDMFPSKWMAASDLDGTDRIVQIRGLTQEKVGMDGEMKWVLWFHGETKALVLNVTNTKVICALLGDDTDDWEGSEIVLYSAEVSFAGEMVDAIRVRKKLPTPSVARSAATRTPAQVKAAGGSRKPATPLTQQDVDLDDSDDQIPF